MKNYGPVIVLTSSPDFDALSLQVVCFPVVQKQISAHAVY